MKRLLAYLFIVLGLTFSLQSWTKADDIRDFEIEGMSIGDSLLDYFSEEEINKKIDNEELITCPGSDKYYGMSFGNENFFKTYEFIKFHMKKNDKKFTIVSITGVIDYPNNFEDCLKTKKKIVKEIKESYDFINVQNYTSDFKGKGGKSISYISDFDFSGDGIRIWCSQWDKKNKYTKTWIDDLNVGVSTKEFFDFLNYEAYK